MKLFQLIKEFAKIFTKKRQTTLTISAPPPDRYLAVPTPSAVSPSPSSIDLSDLDSINILGEGGSSIVHLVHHRPTNQLYALKVIHGPNKEVSREIKILSTTDSPFIVRCHGIFRHGKDIQVLLEYMDGGHIGKIGRVLESTLANMARQILQGLAYLHSKKIVHRDLKPENILINSQNEIKISDFGVSRFLTGSMRVCTSDVGTIKYMSPERLKREPYDGYASDIWSFGISVLECYLGRFPVGLTLGPFSGESLPEVPADTSEKFQSFIKCCLQIEPSERWTAHQLLNHPFITERDDGNAQALIEQNPPAASSSSSSSSSSSNSAHE